MRKEATLAQWKDLYEVAIRIKELKPWEYLWDMDIITIMLPDREEPYYCSIMGRAGECFSIGTYAGFDAMNDFFEVVENPDIPPEQVLRYQNNMMCYFGNRDELTKKEWNIIKDLGLKFRGKNNWIYFHSFKTGYVPYLLDAKQVVALTEVFRQLYMALRAYIERGLQVDFEKGNTLLRKYDKTKELWYSYESQLLLPPRQYLVPVLQDDLLMARLKKQKKTGEQIEIDIVYLNVVINDKKLERPVYPKMCIVADCNNGMLIDHEMISPEDDEVEVILNTIINYILQVGKPEIIHVRDEYVEALLSDICKRTNIKTKMESSLRGIDTFVRNFEHRRV